MSTDAIVILKEQHRQLRRLARVARRPAADLGGPVAVDGGPVAVDLRIVLDAFEAHLDREGQAVAEMCAALPSTDDVDPLASLRADRDAVRAQRTAIDAAVPADDALPERDRWRCYAAELAQAVDRHIATLEGRLFPVVRRGLGRRRLGEIGAGLRTDPAAAARDDEARAPTSVIVDRSDGLTVVRVVGPADAPAARGLRTALLDEIASGRRHLAVDLGGVTRMDSAGLRVLLEARRAVGGHGSVRLVVPEDALYMRRTLLINGMQKSFEITAAAADP